MCICCRCQDIIALLRSHCDDGAGFTREIFKDGVAFESDRGLLGSTPDSQQRVLKAVLDQQWAGIEEYSEVVPLHAISSASLQHSFWLGGT